MVDREVDRPAWMVLGRSWGLCVRSWAALGAYVGGLGGGLGTYGGDLGPLLGLYGRSGSALGASVCGPGLLLEPMLAIWGRF